MDYFNNCPFCGQASQIIYFHGHGQCNKCGRPVNDCCSGEISQSKNKEEEKLC